MTYFLGHVDFKLYTLKHLEVLNLRFQKISILPQRFFFSLTPHPVSARELHGAPHFHDFSRWVLLPLVTVIIYSHSYS